MVATQYTLLGLKPWVSATKRAEWTRCCSFFYQRLIKWVSRGLQRGGTIQHHMSYILRDAALSSSLPGVPLASDSPLELCSLPCCERSAIRSTRNIFRSSSSRAMSPRKAAGIGKYKKVGSVRETHPCYHCKHRRCTCTYWTPLHQIAFFKLESS